jgi:predicted Zn-dependent peptidase
MFGKNEEYSFKNDTILGSASLIEPKLIFMNKNLNQYITRLSFATFPASQARNHIMLSFIQYCLTGAGLFSLLNHDIREVRGLVYTMHSYSDAFRFAGFYYIQIGSSSSKTEYIISLVMNIITKMKKQGLPDKVLTFYKDSYLSATKLRILDEDYRSEKHGTDFFYGSYVDDKELLKIIKGISQEDVINVSRLAFDFDRMGVISIGSYNNVDKMSVSVQDIIESYKNL